MVWGGIGYRRWRYRRHVLGLTAPEHPVPPRHLSVVMCRLVLTLTSPDLPHSVRNAAIHHPNALGHYVCGLAVMPLTRKEADNANNQYMRMTAVSASAGRPVPMIKEIGGPV